MASLLVISGPPGSGKSTVAAILADLWDRSVLVAGDRFFGFLASGAIPPWLPESHRQNTVVTEAAAAATGRFATEYDTVYEGIVGPWFLSTFTAGTGLRQLHYAMLLPSAGTCQRRVATREGHGFSDLDATIEMHREFSTAEIGSRHVLRNESDDPHDTANQIAEAMQAGRLRYPIATVG